MSGRVSGLASPGRDGGRKPAGPGGRRNLLNALLFQLGWFACVLGGTPVAQVFLPLYLVVHFTWISTDPREWRFTALVVLLGCALDAIAVSAGVFTFEGSSFLPFWLVALWVLFATLVPHGLSWLQGRLWLAAAAGAAGGTLSYVAGLRLGVAEAPVLPLAVGWWAIQWAVLLPSLLLAGPQCAGSRCT
jgi:hypothetical protein